MVRYSSRTPNTTPPAARRLARRAARPSATYRRTIPSCAPGGVPAERVDHPMGIYRILWRIVVGVLTVGGASLAFLYVPWGFVISISVCALILGPPDRCRDPLPYPRISRPDAAILHHHRRPRRGGCPRGVRPHRPVRRRRPARGGPARGVLAPGATANTAPQPPTTSPGSAAQPTPGGSTIAPQFPGPRQPRTGPDTPTGPTTVTVVPLTQ